MAASNIANILDGEALLDRVGGDLEFLRELSGLFREDCPVLLEQIRAAVDAGDPRGLERAAHSLKGSVSNFGAEAARQAAFRLEGMGRAGDLSRASEAYAELESEIVRFTDALEGLSRGLQQR